MRGNEIYYSVFVLNISFFAGYNSNKPSKVVIGIMTETELESIRTKNYPLSSSLKKYH